MPSTSLISLLHLSTGVLVRFKESTGVPRHFRPVDINDEAEELIVEEILLHLWRLFPVPSVYRALRGEHFGILSLLIFPAYPPIFTPRPVFSILISVSPLHLPVRRGVHCRHPLHPLHVYLCISTPPSSIVEFYLVFLFIPRHLSQLVMATFLCLPHFEMGMATVDMCDPS